MVSARLFWLDLVVIKLIFEIAIFWEIANN
jgi:hypothetical protein